MHLRESLDKIPSYVKNPNNIGLMCKCLNKLDDNIFLFTADSTVIHPNINIEEGLKVLTLALDNLIFKVQPTWPRREIITAMQLLLRFNDF